MHDEGLIQDYPSLSDYGMMMQTGWFGEIANNIALTRGGLLGPRLDSGFDVTETIRILKEDAKFQVFSVQTDENSGKLCVVLSEGSKNILRAQLKKTAEASRRIDTVGCPVARTAVAITPKVADLLEKYGHVDPARSGWWKRRILEDGKILLDRGSYTAIDEVIYVWGDYLLRCARTYSALFGQDYSK